MQWSCCLHSWDSSWARCSGTVLKHAVQQQQRVQHQAGCNAAGSECGGCNVQRASAEQQAPALCSALLSGLFL
jgi:hypothetical protein